MTDTIITKRYTSANDFLKDISYGGEMYSQITSNCVYRGLKSGTYKLVPSILRHRIQCLNQDGSIYDEHNENAEMLSDSEWMQRDAEYWKLRLFFEFCDKNNLRLPNVDRMREHLFSYKDFESAKMALEDWIPYDLQELAALAQHYGMETRLLDWSSSIETAIYFAIHQEPFLTEEDEQKDDSKFVVIWVLDTFVATQGSRLRVIRPAYHGNPNLAAQKGLFTYWNEPRFILSSNNITVEEYHEHLKRKVNRASLNELLKVELEKKQYDQTAMWKLMIPREFKCELYDYINRKHVNADSLFPGYGGVVQCLKEKNEFDRMKMKRDFEQLCY